MARPVKAPRQSARAKRVTQKAETIPARLQSYVNQALLDKRRRIECCRNWQQFSPTRRIAKQTANYAAAERGFAATSLQAQAIAGWPPEQLLVLKQLVEIILKCPKQGGPGQQLPIKATFSARRGARRGLQISISDPDNVLHIRFIAPVIV